MIQGLSPIAFLLINRLSGGVTGGVGPMQPTVSPFVFGTPFGITDADIKGPGQPLPLLMGNIGFGRQRVPGHRGRVTPQPTKLVISGVTKDSTGAVLASCTVTLLSTADNVALETVTSDASGNYAFSAVGLGETYYVLAYKAGSPDVAGTSVNTLVGV